MNSSSKTDKCLPPTGMQTQWQGGEFLHVCTRITQCRLITSHIRQQLLVHSCTVSMFLKSIQLAKIYQVASQIDVATVQVYTQVYKVRSIYWLPQVIRDLLKWDGCMEYTKLSIAEGAAEASGRVLTTHFTSAYGATTQPTARLRGYKSSLCQ